MLISQQEAKQLVDKILSFSKADDCNVTIGASDTANTRFANNSITTSGEVSGVVISLASTKKAQTGNYSTNETSDDVLRAAVAKSEELAGYAPADPEYVEPLGPQKYSEITAYDEATAKAAHKQMTPGVKAAITGAEEKKLVSAGYFERATQALAVGNKRGNFGYATRTASEYSVTVRTPDGSGSGWASAEGHRMAEVDAPAVARVAIDKAVLSQKPRRLEPGKYTVILEPAAVSQMVPLMLASFNARAAEEGRSLLTKKGGGTRLGEKMFSEKITLRSDPFDPRNPGLPWAGLVPTQLSGVGQFIFEGGGEDPAFNSFLPARKMTWVDKGVITNLAYTRYWAKKRGVEPTPFPDASLVIEGEHQTLDDLIKSTEHGLLVTHFWYIEYLNAQTVQLTGLTRDGLFMIEKGKSAYPVMNFRWNESPANVLANVEMLSRPVLSGGNLVPAIKVRDFTFSSLSDAV